MAGGMSLRSTSAEFTMLSKNPRTFCNRDFMCCQRSNPLCQRLLHLQACASTTSGIHRSCVKAFMFHPGVIPTRIGIESLVPLPLVDTVALAAASTLHFTTGKTDWLTGREKMEDEDSRADSRAEHPCEQAVSSAVGRVHPQTRSVPPCILTICRSGTLVHYDPYFTFPLDLQQTVCSYGKQS
ncbi:hypothetical protein HETIRDRAFT_420865 [Heterobasidion irregulare TC 32-1]|uniref:Uncharacterized protein n=1 Tax=Heterobasidion irregulare (strain TC 32-1) TaxID=747525 RepID=W4JX83_HETIT|nr:uncharacterized protein HETIRDRAFT_420865 [Heterobasidion irregulare TC 32-1]ETW78069.1 hypothetical protein HETIRDRAFT_420865 [Heterobasidion irregulare TC 32-1]